MGHISGISTVIVIAGSSGGGKFSTSGEGAILFI